MADTSTPHILIIVASTRTQRFADHPLAWLRDRLAAEPDLTFEVLDLREHPLPFYDRPVSPAMARREYSSPEERTVGEILERADGFLVITNEYNHGYSAALKNVLDHYFAEFNHKPMSFVGYGNVGGSRAIEQLRLVAAELDMASVRPTVHLFGPQMMEIRNDPAAAAEVFAALDPRLDLLIADLRWWSSALKTARDAEVSSAAA
jgi:NAD(P)H-dependent FMN reductase